ncbi:hypothetical protein MMC27_007111 [Xylographa pallens]|nr:hypothetical protein [Xylographa pallens]
MYLTGQHNVIPEKSLLSEVTHVALAFMRSDTFNKVQSTTWPLFTTVETIRSHFPPGTAVMVAIGGWGDTSGFSQAAATDISRKLFAENVKAMVDATGADGIDIDWEYPGLVLLLCRSLGNGEDYKTIPNVARTWEIDAYPKLLSEIRSALGPHRLISAAVPGLLRDMLAFTESTVPAISASLDFFNVMTYDLMNRRDNITKHHTGISLSLDAINAYAEHGVPTEKMNLGFAFYIKWYRADPNSSCDLHPIGCKTALMEDPVTGADLGNAGAFSWHDAVPKELSASYQRAMEHGRYDAEAGGHYYWDTEENLWWSWDTPEAIARKFPFIVKEKGLGGVFAWALGEDAQGFVHLKAVTAGVEGLRGGKTEMGKEWPKEEL